MVRLALRSFVFVIFAIWILAPGGAIAQTAAPTPAIFEQDLGRNTDRVARRISSCDPR